MPASAAIPLSLALGFLLGSLPFGYWLGRLRGIDLLAVGSGSIGATNVFRNLGWRLGVLAFALDVGKGAGSVLIAKRLVPAASPAGPEVWVILAGLLAVASHSYSFWLGFRGGRGVASGLGIVLAVSPAAGLCGFAVWALALAITRYVSVASILGCISVVAWAEAYGVHPVYTGFIALAVVVIVARHIPNLRRLAAGTEPRLGARKRAESERTDV